MPTLREVKKRIRTVVSTKRITKAMEMVAAANLRRAQQKVEQARPYNQSLELLLSHLAAASSDEISHPFFEERDIKKKTLVVITSDRGLCGSYNGNAIRRAAQWLEENKEFELEVVTIGKKGNDFFKRRQWPVAAHFGDWGGSIDYAKAKDIANFLTWRFLKHETDEINLLFTRFLSMVRYRLSVDRYLPVARPKEEEEAGYNVDYIFEPSAEAIYGSVLPNYTSSKLIIALAESFASEHGSRMIAMGNATSNAEEMVDTLTLQYNKARQAQITKELLEIVSGAEALRS